MDDVFGEAGDSDEEELTHDSAESHMRVGEYEALAVLQAAFNERLTGTLLTRAGRRHLRSDPLNAALLRPKLDVALSLTTRRRFPFRYGGLFLGKARPLFDLLYTLDYARGRGGLFFGRSGGIVLSLLSNFTREEGVLWGEGQHAPQNLATSSSELGLERQKRDEGTVRDTGTAGETCSELNNNPPGQLHAGSFIRRNEK